MALEVPAAFWGWPSNEASACWDPGCGVLVSSGGTFCVGVPTASTDSLRRGR